MQNPKDVNASNAEFRDVVAEALSFAKRAEELRGEAIKRLLEQQREIENNLRVLGYTAPANGNAVNHNTGKPEQHHHIPGKRFKDLKFAEVGKILLSEHSRLHGTEIEKLAREGGFKGSANNFQTYLRTAFLRDGGFKKVGRNVWTLKENH